MCVSGSTAHQHDCVQARKAIIDIETKPHMSARPQCSTQEREVLVCEGILGCTDRHK